MNEATTFLARDLGLSLVKESDALDAIGTGLPGCVFTAAELSDGFFDLKNGLAGQVFQKFVNYQFRMAIVLPENHGYGERVEELIRDHRNHSTIRFFTEVNEAVAWVRS